MNTYCYVTQFLTKLEKLNSKHLIITSFPEMHKNNYIGILLDYSWKYKQFDSSSELSVNYNSTQKFH